MSIGLLVIRLAVGLTIAAHGAQKLGALGGHGLDGTGRFMESLGFRPGRRHAEMAAVAEVACGLMLAAGALTPLAAAGVIGLMVVAGAAAHGRNGFFATSGGFEYPFVLGAVAAGLAFAGAGVVSVDWLLDLDLGGALWGVLALVLGGGAGVAQLATRHREVDAADVDLRDDATTEVRR